MSDVTSRWQSNRRFRKRLAYKQTRDVVLISFLVGLMMSLLQIYFDFSSESESYEETMLQVMRTVEQPAAQAAYNLDIDLASEVVSGLFAYKAIVQVRIFDDLGNELTGIERQAPGSDLRWITEALFGKAQRYRLTLVNEEAGGITSGELDVVADTHALAVDFIQRSFLVISLGLLRNIILATILSILFYYLLARPLLRLSHAFAEVDPDRPDQTVLDVPHRNREDELHDLAEAGNRLLEVIGERIAERNTAEAELREFTASLERRVEERTQQLEEQYEAAQAANISKRMFLATMSHELRTPMNAVLGFAELLRESDLTESQRSKVSGILESGESLLHLINDILDFSKMEAGQLELEEISYDLPDLLAQVASVTGGSASEKGLELVFHIQSGLPRTLRGDPTRIGQILINMVNNGIKFTETGEIEILVEHVSEQDGADALVISVTDTGIGMTESEISDLFQPFTQLDNSMSRQFGGTGLGLAICRQLADLMQARIDVISERGKGSCFRIALPYSPVTDDISEDVFDGGSVLVLESHPAVARSIQDCLRAWSFEVECLGGLGGFEDYQTNRAPDFMIIDKSALGEESAAALSGLRKALGGDPKIVLLCDLTRDVNLGEIQKIHGVDEVRYKPVHEAMLRSLFISRSDPCQSHTSPMDHERADRWDGRVVLLAEDNQVNQDIARAYLEKMGVKVVLAENGRDALDLLMDRDVDLVLMDIQMPVMDGIEATMEIRKNSVHAELPIIALTAHAMAHEKEECLSAGMNGHLAKPLRPVELRSTLREWLPVSTIEQADLETCEDPMDISVEENETSENLQDKLDELKDLVGQDGFASLVEDAVKGAKGYLTEIQECVAKKDPAGVRRAAHSLKGMSGSMFAMGLSKCAAEVEHQYEDSEKVKSCLPHLETATEEACSWWSREGGVVSE